MQTTQIPGVSFPVSKLCLGTARFGTLTSKEDSFATLDTYFQLGGRFFNTAHEYGAGQAEAVLGAWIRERGIRDQITVTTKGGEDMTKPRARDMGHDALLQDIDESLTRMGLENVDFYMLHLDDERVSVSEILETLEEIVKAGKARHYGCSNWSVPRQREAEAYAKSHGLQGFVIDEIQFNMAGDNERNINACKYLSPDFIALHEEDGKCIGGYSPLAAGCIAKLIRDGDTRNWRRETALRFDNAYTTEVAKRIKRLSEETGWTPSQIQLAWLLNPPFPFPSFLIFGASAPAQLEDSMRSFDITLTPEMIAWLQPDLRDYPELLP